MLVLSRVQHRARLGCWPVRRLGQAPGQSQAPAARRPTATPPDSAATRAPAAVRLPVPRAPSPSLPAPSCCPPNPHDTAIHVTMPSCLADGEGAGEDGAALWSVRSAEVAAVGLQDAQGDRQPEPGDAGLPVPRGLAAVEGGEEVGQILRGDTRTGVLHLETMRGAFPLPCHSDLAPGRGMAEGVVE
jgi:hypothetical protein